MVRHTLIFSALVTLFFIVSCSASKKAVYFKNDLPSDTAVFRQNMEEVTDVVVQSDDILAINVTSSSFGQENAIQNIFNGGGTQYSITPTSQPTATSTQNSGYLVDKEGFIDFPVIGKTKAMGLTIRQIKDKLADTLKHYVTAPVVEVRIINYKVTVLGEVARPGTVIATNHKINILQALATSGDIPVTGRKDNVMVIREQKGQREFATINLNSKELFKSPYFNLKQNDIVYVEPSKVRRSETNEFIRVYLPIISTVISTALTAYAISVVKR